MERGLEGLPSIYYPDKTQYDCVAQDPNLPLPFHCYEAHIPYTMQFFKDYNLSGMAYIHLSDTSGKQHSLMRFRDPLPKRPSCLHLGNHPLDDHFMFLESNTPDSYRWKETSIVVDEANSIPSHSGGDDHTLIMQQQQPSDSDPSPAQLEFCIKKETSCGIELDVSVEAILNVFSVMTDIGEEDKDIVHWRAVPSLKEIWQEERRRMSKLVPPSNDFLSQEMTLAVKKGAATPGARLAVKGMRDLVNVTQGLHENFQRVLREIVERHRGAIDRVDDYLRQCPPVTPHSKGGQSTSFTPSNDETLEDLGALGGLFGDPSSLSQSISTASQDETSIELLSSQLSQTATPLSQSDQRFKELSQPYYDLRQSQMDDCASTEFEMSQRVERGEGIVVNGPYEELDDFIDPQTLLPYDDAGEDEEEDGFGGKDTSEDQIERELHDLATQPLIQIKEKANLYAHRSPSEATPSLSKRSNSFNDPQEMKEEIVEMRTESIVHLSLGASNIPHKLTLRSRPPTRKSVLSGDKAAGLYAMQAKNLTPEWMRHLLLYHKHEESRNNFGMPEHYEKYGFHLVREPPNREAVQKWYKAGQKKSRKTVITESGQQSPSITEVSTCLLLEENSRKLVITAHSAESSVEETKIAAADWTEEMTSQPIQTASTNVCYDDTPQSVSPRRGEVLDGIGNQGGRLYIEGGGELKAKTRPSQTHPSRVTQTSISQPYLPSPVTLMVLEVHVQCRVGRAGVTDSKTISMAPNSDRDKVSAVVYVFGKDPGGGEALEIIERGCIFVPIGKEIELAGAKADRPFESLAASVRRSMPKAVLGVSAPLSIESVRDERQLLLRIASIIRLKDPEILCSWDTQGLGTGYLIERGIAIGKEKGTGADPTSGSSNPMELDLARLFGRTPTYSAVTRGMGPNAGFFQSQIETTTDGTPQVRWKGSGLGVEWDERVGAGAAAASVVSCGDVVDDPNVLANS